jgi:tRNA modification GTPase
MSTETFLANINSNDTICALATPPGLGAIAVIRLSGEKTFSIVEQIFRPAAKNTSVQEAAGHTLMFGTLADKTDEILDEVLVSIFRAPRSYTGEDAIEIACHGSVYIQQEILKLLINQGARMAQPGEFTLRAFAHGKMDLAQAEAVADLVDAHSKTSHDLALNQMRGAYSSKIKSLRKQLLDFTSLIELELDFSEEDVEFANREKLQALLREIKQELTQLIASFSMGNAIKKGIPVTIIGEPNVGKSTLLNALLNEERAIVSEIPGTTRDAVEDNLVIDGYTFRFIDTAGLRQTEDHVESIGIDRTYEKIKQARIVLFVFDITQTTCEEVKEKLKEFDHEIQHQEKTFILIGNKTDELVRTPHYFNELVNMDVIFVSAKRKENINLVIQKIVEAVQIGEIGDATIVSNSRHYQELKKTLEAIEAVKKGFDNDLPTDLIAIDIRTALHHLGEITGEITTDEILGNIFGKFCIGK